ncbi:hypothetical protein ASPZODRAFT_103401 [Penicilliopsis zonata CBS 506.65]|uniref:UBX domain-containing protein 2 n=1 Tax=Penicilliopsis zonata CBS 506.65 TaxID=1073090 RepID=A0A1L9S8E6_9EURO|nr:hypothetical protein ASPZODRAFT_103401 [Penicilliopsis zonata CBS 506.65]OJJ43424.1 hypothetical protein ASPZODRAFT_103401 [Penicilliopsis zonata CBS 506.65]
MFFEGSLQEGIALAVSEVKAVVCFVRDDTPTSSEWEDEYFAGEEQFAALLKAKSVLLRLSAGSQEVGFLTSFCPIAKFPAVVVIRNGMLREYIIPDITKDDFRRRLTAALEEQPPPPVVPEPVRLSQQQTEGGNAPEMVPVPRPAVSSHQAPQPSPASSTTRESQPRDNGVEKKTESTEQSKKSKFTKNPSPATQKSVQPKQERQVTSAAAKQNKVTRDSSPQVSKPKSPPINIHSSLPQTPQETGPSPPTQYRLSVRLFDGSSVRSSFSPSQTIRRHVRPWLEEQLAGESRPFNLKHILTPLPNRNLTIAEEEQTLQELGLGPTASLVMVPISSYTEAYTGSESSLPVRGAYAAYGLVSSAVVTVSGLVGSFLGYGQTQPPPSESQPVPETQSTPSMGGASRPRPYNTSRGPHIRTLRDQYDERNNSQFYNGNQLNFEPQDE